METKVKENKGNNTIANGKPANAEAIKKEINNINTPASEQNGTPKNDGVTVKPVEVIHIEQEKKAEQPKAEIKFEKPALNLEGTLKLVEELHRRKIQRDRLLATITTLEAFELEMQEDADEADTNYYQGCVLTIEDDNRRKFTTKNPVIIQAVSQHVNSLCINKLAEIEAGIIIPA